MRRALIALGAAALVVVPSAGAAPPRRSLVLPEAVVGQPAIAGGSMFYMVRTRRQDVIKRLDLTTLQSVRVYAKRNASWGFGVLYGGGGRVAVQVDDVNPRGGLASKVVELDPAGGPPRALASGRVRNARLQNCGSEMSLEHVSQDGAVVIDKASIGCGRSSRARHVLSRYPVGPPSVLARYTERLTDESRRWRLAGTRLLEATERGARVRDLAAGGTRPIRRRSRGFLVTWADIDAAGNVVLGELGFPSRSVRELVRLIAPYDPPTGGRVLFDARDTQDQPRFCGSRLVEQRVSRDRQELLVYDDLAGAPRVAFSAARRSRDLEIQLACDAETAVLVDFQRARRTAVQVVPLAPV